MKIFVSDILDAMGISKQLRINLEFPKKNWLILKKHT